MSNQKAEIRSLENSILVYSDYKSKVKAGHTTKELKQEKMKELENQIQDCKEAIEELKKNNETKLFHISLTMKNNLNFRLK